MKQIQVTIQEIWMAMKPLIHSSKKIYTRKKKHKKIEDSVGS
jgi:hypothetical protein